MGPTRSTTHVVGCLWILLYTVSVFVVYFYFYFYPHGPRNDPVRIYADRSGPSSSIIESSCTPQRNCAAQSSFIARHKRHNNLLRSSLHLIFFFIVLVSWYCVPLLLVLVYANLGMRMYLYDYIYMCMRIYVCVHVYMRIYVYAGH